MIDPMLLMTWTHIEFSLLNSAAAKLTIFLRKLLSFHIPAFPKKHLIDIMPLTFLTYLLYINPCIIRSFYFRLEIKKGKSDKLFCFLFLILTQKKKKCHVFHISILGANKKYEMEKQTTGLNLILIFNWSWTGSYE